MLPSWVMVWAYGDVSPVVAMPMGIYAYTVTKNALNRMLFSMLL